MSMESVRAALGRAAFLWGWSGSTRVSQGLSSLLWWVGRSLRAVDRAGLAAVPGVTGRRLRLGTEGGFPSVGHSLVTQARPGGSAPASRGPWWPLCLTRTVARVGWQQLAGRQKAAPSWLPMAHGCRKEDGALWGCAQAEERGIQQGRCRRGVPSSLWGCGVLGARGWLQAGGSWWIKTLQATATCAKGS